MSVTNYLKKIKIYFNNNYYLILNFFFFGKFIIIKNCAHF